VNKKILTGGTDDFGVAANANYVVQVINWSIQIFDKNGNLLIGPYLDYNRFFGTNSICCDAHVWWDEQMQRWVADAVGSANGNIIAVSDTADPTGTWKSKYFETTDNSFYDMTPTMFGSDFYMLHAGGNPCCTVFKKSDLQNGVFNPIQQNLMIGASRDNGSAFDSPAGVSYSAFVVGGANPGLAVTKYSNVTTPGGISQQSWFVPLPSSASWVTLGQLQLGRNGKIPFLASTNWSKQANLYCGVLDVSGSAPVLKQSGTLNSGASKIADNWDIAVDPNGDVGISYVTINTGNTTTYYVTGRNGSDAPNTLQTPVVVTNISGATYAGSDFTDINLDYNSSGVQNSFWAVQNVDHGNSIAMPNWSISPAAAPTSAPAAPTGVSIRTWFDGPIISWANSSGATSYNILRSTSSGGPYTTVGSTTANCYMDNVAGTTYYYVIQAVNSIGQSANSSQVSGAG